MSVEGKVILITGAASGIGRALALGFASEGARVIGADIDRAGLAEAKNQSASGFITLEADVSKPEDCERLINEAHRTHGRIDVLINNAGIARPGLFHEVEFDDSSPDIHRTAR